ncbi:PREDICTED: uncharacterized protein LOC104744454 [Camelina sativa]|uniref:Uncharacterized protein LOC104744454 n=1 Tax=Camelina sativa TaxID=90675 RepID=A0ABM0W030_CAMSA|nr:PREDICTED: uncharacterized protein LOC104744454 [Camelina sativa]
MEIPLPSSGAIFLKMQRREEKRREFHEALLQTLYPPSSPPSPSPVEVVDDEPFDVTLINPEDYLKINSSINGEDNEIGDESGNAEKPSRAQRKRLRKRLLKEEAVRRKKVIIGPLLPTDGRRVFVGDASGSNVEKEDSDSEEEEDEASESKTCSQPVRLNATGEKQVKFDDNDKTSKVKKRREAKKLAKDSSKPNSYLHNPTPDPN